MSDFDDSLPPGERERIDAQAKRDREARPMRCRGCTLPLRYDYDLHGYQAPDGTWSCAGVPRLHIPEGS